MEHLLGLETWPWFNSMLKFGHLKTPYILDNAPPPPSPTHIRSSAKLKLLDLRQVMGNGVHLRTESKLFTLSWGKHIAQKISMLRRIKQKGTSRVTMGYLPDYYAARYRILYHSMGLCA